MRIDDITVGARHRADMGDLDALAKSIAEVGLLHPVTVTPDGVLICGRRRLAACRLLGWDEIPVTVLALDDLLRGEQEENTQRKDFTPSEAAAIGRALEERVRPEALERRRETLKQFTDRSGNLRQRQPGKTADIVGAAVGMSGSRYERIKAVVEAAEADPETFGPVVEEMDRTGKVEPAYAQTRAHRRREATPAGPFRGREATAARRARIVEMARRGYREDVIASEVGVNEETVKEAMRAAGVPTIAQKIGRAARLDADRIMEGIVANADPPAPVIRALDWAALDRSRFGVWDERLTTAIRVLTQVRNKLREEMNA